MPRGDGAGMKRLLYALAVLWAAFLTDGTLDMMGDSSYIASCLWVNLASELTLCPTG